MEWSSGRWAARAGLVLLTLFGLVAMHGLPGAMAGPGAMAPMPALSESAFPLAAATLGSPTLAEPLLADATMVTTTTAIGQGRRRQADHAVSQVSVVPVVSAHARAGRDVTRTTSRLVAEPAGCGMDHAQCVAVLRDPGHSSVAAPTPDADAGRAVARLASVSDPGHGSRAPPGVSLIRLGISRT